MLYRGEAIVAGLPSTPLASVPPALADKPLFVSPTLASLPVDPSKVCVMPLVNCMRYARSLSTPGVRSTSVYSMRLSRLL